MWYASICFYLRPWFKWSWPLRLSSPSAHSQFTPFHVHYSKTAQLEICFKSMSNDTFFARNCYIPKWSYIKANATCHSRTKIEFTRTDSQDNFIAITSGTISTKNFTNFLGLGPCSGTEYYDFFKFSMINCYKPYIFREKRLFPLPDLLILCDSHEGYNLNLSGTMCINPSSFNR